MDSDMIYDYPCTSCKENGLNSESVCYCEQCEKCFCFVCENIHNRILKEHNILNKSKRNCWNKGNGDGSRYTILDKSQQELWTEENGGSYTSAEGLNPRQDIELDRPKDTQAKEVTCEVFESPFTTLCGIVGNDTLNFDATRIRIMRSERNSYVDIPLNMIRQFGRKQTCVFFLEIGRRFSFGEGFIDIKCSSREDAKLACTYLDEAFGKWK